MFQELQTFTSEHVQYILFFHIFYVLESPWYFTHQNKKCEIIIVPWTMGTHQSDPLRGSLFSITHFRVAHFPFYIFPTIIDDTHILGPSSEVIQAFEFLTSQL
jgi:hypothetical protein